jgi:ABC-type transporter Mla subunit MlaD
VEPAAEPPASAELPARLEALARALRAADEAVAARAGELRALADRAIARADELDRALAEAVQAAHEARAALAGEPPPARREIAAVPEPAADGAALETARLVAIEMAVAGRTREEVEAHLLSAYELPDTAALMADVFGESPRRRAGSL